MKLLRVTFLPSIKKPIEYGRVPMTYFGHFYDIGDMIFENCICAINFINKFVQFLALFNGIRNYFALKDDMSYE